MALQPDSEGRYTKTLKIKSLDVKLDGSNSLSEFIQGIKEYSKTNIPQDVIYKTMDRINNEVTRIEKTNDNSENVTRIKRAISNAFNIPEIRTQAYSKAADLTNALSVLVPPTPLEIFNSWDRISNQDYYPRGEGATGEADAWVWDGSLNSMRVTINSATHLGFLSTDQVVNYRHEATVRSTDADDDWNGLILAYKREGNYNNYISVQVCCDGTNDATSASHNVDVKMMMNGTQTRLLTVPTDNRTGGWRNAFKRIKIERRGDDFDIQLSPWNSTEYHSDYKLHFNLNDFSGTDYFSGPQKYGYYNYSQNSSFWEDIRFYDGFLRDVIVDVRLNEVYKYRLNQGWVKLSGVRTQDIYGSPRVITNADGSERYRLNDDYSIDIL